MNEAHESAACPLTDEVLALFLDGANDPSTPPAREELALHRDECEVCRDALERARRLDALVAATAVRGVSEARREAFLATAFAAREAEPMPSRVRRLARPIAAATLLVVLGAALGAWFAGAFAPAAQPSPLPSPQPQAARVVEAAVETPTPAPVFAIDSEWLLGLPAPIAIATGAGSRPMRARAPSVEDCASILRSPWLVGSRLVLPDAADSVARACAATLLTARAHELAFAALVELPDDFRRATLAAVAARAPDFVAFVGARLRDRDARTLVVAACLPGASVDAELLAFAAGDESRAFAVAAALRAPRTRDGRAALLLALIDDVLA
ncbi:MAG: hypothetical protein HZB39_21305, partial [Planctomycetes bacterium]|nr:hypothetical protein [Planctomycetota bacterium]